MSLCVLYQESPPSPHRMKRDIKQEFLLLPPPETANEKEEFEWEYGVVLPITKKSTSLRLDQLGKRGRGIPTTERSQEYHAKNPQFNYSEFFAFFTASMRYFLNSSLSFSEHYFVTISFLYQKLAMVKVFQEFSLLANDCRSTVA